jgi:hypothetical protein
VHPQAFVPYPLVKVIADTASLDTSPAQTYCYRKQGNAAGFTRLFVTFVKGVWIHH